ncbi:unnamed protein product [Malus baccata var. baccata]
MGLPSPEVGWSSKQKADFEEFTLHRKMMKCYPLNPSLLHWRRSLSLLQENVQCVFGFHIVYGSIDSFIT